MKTNEIKSLIQEINELDNDVFDLDNELPYEDIDSDIDLPDTEDDYYKPDPELDINLDDLEPEVESSDLGGNDVDVLSNLISQKDSLLDKLKNKEISLDQYKAMIGDIPQRIKQLRSQVNPEMEDEEGELTINESKRRLQKIAGLLK